MTVASDDELYCPACGTKSVLKGTAVAGGCLKCGSPDWIPFDQREEYERLRRQVGPERARDEVWAAHRGQRTADSARGMVAIAAGALVGGAVYVATELDGLAIAAGIAALLVAVFVLDRGPESPEPHAAIPAPPPTPAPPAPLPHPASRPADKRAKILKAMPIAAPADLEAWVTRKSSSRGPLSIEHPGRVEPLALDAVIKLGRSNTRSGESYKEGAASAVFHGSGGGREETWHIMRVDDGHWAIVEHQYEFTD